MSLCVTVGYKLVNGSTMIIQGVTLRGTRVVDASFIINGLIILTPTIPQVIVVVELQ
jgi:hypothetical protein